MFQYALVSEVRELIAPMDLDVFDSLLTGREFEEVRLGVNVCACVRTRVHGCVCA